MTRFSIRWTYLLRPLQVNAATPQTRSTRNTMIIFRISNQSFDHWKQAHLALHNFNKIFVCALIVDGSENFMSVFSMVLWIKLGDHPCDR